MRNFTCKMTILMTVTMCVLFLLAEAFFVACADHSPPTVAFEAAFQGECREDSPCQQLCFDLHDGTYECACQEGFNLEDNGYNCVALEVRTPRFLGASYLALPVLRDASQTIRLEMDFRPEVYEGLVLYSGENSDLEGDFISISLNGGFVEFRFDCGMGEGVLRSDQPVVLHTWNKMIIHRDGWSAWLQINNGQQVQGRSQGMVSKITFKQYLYVGGSPNISQVESRTQSGIGFRGCVRQLQINAKTYSFRSDSSGDGIEGFDIEECSSDVCNTITCMNGGQCISAKQGRGSCLCPLGFGGDRCETAINIIVPSFNGSSYLQFPGLASSSLSFTEISVVFRPLSLNGVLLYNGCRMNSSGDFLSLNLAEGFVEFRLDLGSGSEIIRSLEPVAVNDWHTAFITRTGRAGTLQVDNQPSVTGLAPGAFTQLSVPLNLYVGGLPDLKDVAEDAEVSSMFTGCIQRISINGRPIKLLEQALSGVNVGNCYHLCLEKPCLHGGSCVPSFDSYTCHCLLGYTGVRCEKEVLEVVSEPMFSGSSYLHYVDEEIMKRIQGKKFDIRMRFRSLAPSGLILWAGNRLVETSSVYLAIRLLNGYVHLQFNLGSGVVTTRHAMGRVDDGLWHSLRVIGVNRHCSLIVDNGPPVSGLSPRSLRDFTVTSGLYLGGVPFALNHRVVPDNTGFVGCLANFTLFTDFHIRLVTHATTGVNVQPCV